MAFRDPFSMDDFWVRSGLLLLPERLLLLLVLLLASSGDVTPLRLGAGLRLRPDSLLD